MKIYKIGIIGATGMVGQRFLTLLENHPWFKVSVLAASSNSSGKSYLEATKNRWKMKEDIPEFAKNMIVYDANDIDSIVNKVDFIFCAVDMKKNDILKLEENYAKHECPVISNNSAHRFTDDVPMIIPEINPEHAQIIPAQRKRLGTKRGFIAVKSNCSLQSYVPAISALSDLKVTKVLACTYQAISGAGKTFDTWPDIKDNIIPYIPGEEEKSELEPMKIWGKVQGNKIISANSPNVTAQCFRVPISDGHTAAVFASFEKKFNSLDEIIHRWNNYNGEAQKLKLPSAPEKFLTYCKQDDFPQIKHTRTLEKSMGIAIGRLRPDSQYDIKFVSTSHNTVRGAAGGAILMAELLCAKGYID